MEQNKQGRQDQSLQKDQQQSDLKQNVQQTSQQSGKDLNRGSQQEGLQQTSTGREQLQNDRLNEDLDRENVGYDEDLNREQRLEERESRSGKLPNQSPDSQDLDR